MSFFMNVACLSGCMAIATGAFGAHGLKSSGAAPDVISTWNTAAHYHLLHSILLVATSRLPNAETANYLLLSGITLFSGSLYALVLTGTKSLGAITPIGGLLLMGGWLALLNSAPRAAKS